VAALAVLLLLPLAARAQTIGGTVSGHVKTEAGSPLSGAKVDARNLATGITRSAAAEASGFYRLPELSAGLYDLTVSAQGFATEVRSGIRIFIGQQSTLDFTLKVAAVAEVVTVEGETPIVEATKSAIGAGITRQQIDQLPLPDRSFTSLAFLAPGITPSVTDGSDISGAGSSGASNTFLIDGLTNDQDALGLTRGDYSPDAIGEYEVLSSAFSAQYGQASGAIINVITRSGGNNFHGRVSAYYRADGLTASDPFASPDPTTGEDKTPFSQWIMSAFLSGPIAKDKAFFFASYEQTWRDATAVVGVDPATLEALGLSGQTTYPQDLREPRAVFKLDYHPTGSQTLTFRFRLDDPKTTNSGVGQATASGAVLTEQAGYTNNTDNTDYGLLHSWVISPATLNEARFQYSIQNNDLSDVNCPDCTTIIRPSVIYGKLPNFPQTFKETRYQFLDSVSLSSAGGEHFFKAGIDYSHAHIDGYVPQNFDGAFVFLTDAPFDAANQATYPFIYQVATGNPNFAISNDIWGLFVQDQWRVNPRLTLNVGLRWDYENQVYVKHDWQNFGPRVHFAWDPTGQGRTSVRGGFGIYYDQIFLNVPLISTLFEPGRYNFQTILLPGYPDPYVGGAQIPIPLPPDISILDAANSTPYKNVGSLGVQQAIGNDMAATLDFVYARGYHLLGIRDANAPTCPTCPRPDENVGIEYDIHTQGQSEYMAMQVGFQKRFSNQFSAQLAYNLASDKTDTDGHQAFQSNPYDRSADWGPSLNDIRNSLNVAFNYQGPWGILAGLSGTYLTGAPYNITTGTDDNGDGQLNDRPAGVGHNSARGNPSWTVNLQLGEVIPIGDMRLQVLVEVFNLFNHINTAGYVGNMQSPFFGEPTRTATNLGLGPRQVQVGVRFDF
jgi:outer membrane receptor protein involved in Fe transport